MRMNSGKYRRRYGVVCAILLIGSLLLTGCVSGPDVPNTEPTPTTVPQQTTQVPTTAPTETEPDPGEAALTSLRQVMVETPQFFAVAYFGYFETSADPYAAMRESAYGLCENLPFLQAIPEERIVGESGYLFCIVPLDEDAAVAVNAGYWDYENAQYIYDDTLYSSSTGEPILLFCDNSSWEFATQVYISGPSGEICWNPQTDDNHCVMSQPNEAGENQFHDFSSYRELLVKKHGDMKDSGWNMPTAEMLVGTTWSWNAYLLDYREYRCSVTFGEDTLYVRWNDGIDEEDHAYPDAAWELTYDEGFAILTVDFREMAGKLRYNLLYHGESQEMYFALDAVQEDMPIGGEPLYRLLRFTPEPVAMIGTWEKSHGEIEGEMVEAEPGACEIEIMSAASGGLLISYTSRDFPDDNFENELLTIDYRAMYYDCGNSAWVADVDYVGPWDTTYTLTLTSDDILIKQNYFLLDGAPTVSYEYFRRIGE